MSDSAYTIPVQDALAFAVSATGKPPEVCQAVIDGWLALIKYEMTLRSDHSPHIVYAKVQDGNYTLRFFELMRIENYLDGDFWIPICRESKQDYAVAKEIMASVEQFLAANNKKFFAPLGLFEVEEKEKYKYVFRLRRDYVPAPTSQELLAYQEAKEAAEEEMPEMGGEG